MDWLVPFLYFFMANGVVFTTNIPTIRVCRISSFALSPPFLSATGPDKQNNCISTYYSGKELGIDVGRVQRGINSKSYKVT